MTPEVRALMALARAVERDEFVRACPHPHLRVLDDIDVERLDWDTGVRSFDAPPEPTAPPSARHYARLACAENTAYPGRVWIGRAPNCEVLLRDISVSKLHAFFVVDGWQLADARSANGTFINGRRLEALLARPVAPGDMLQFGQVRALFLDAAMLYDDLRRPSRPPKTR